MYKCKYCKKDYSCSGNLARHMINSHETHRIKWYNCKHCDSKFKYRTHLKRHVASKHNIDIIWHNCGHCDSKFKSNCELKRHSMHCHNIGVIWYNCNHCGSKFKTKGNLKQHMSDVHDIDIKWFNCKYCDGKFKRNGVLKRHVSYFHNKGPNQCQLCVQNVFNLVPYTDTKTQKDLKICRRCHNKVTGKYTSKEKQMSDYLDKHFGLEYLLGSDERIYGKVCQMYRPDKIYTSPTTILQVECDEFQHNYRSSTYSCEEKRISDIYNEFPGKQYIVIRWNPDKYNGINYSTQDRLKKLVESMNILSKKEKHPGIITVYYMFYDIDNMHIVKNIPFIHLR